MYKINCLDYFLDSVKKFPNNICVKVEGNRYTYYEIYKHALVIASKINKKGAGSNNPVLIALPKSVNAIASIVAVLMTGNIYVPVDINSPMARIAQIRDQLGNHLIIGDANLMRGLVDLVKESVFIDVTDVSKSSKDFEYVFQTTNSSRIDADPAYVIFTSGSTGVPKGVTISHRSIIDYIEWAMDEYRLVQDDVVMSQAPLYFDNSTLDLYMTWYGGAALYIPEDNVYMFPVQILENMSEHGVTSIFWVPSVLVAIANSNLLSSHRVPSLRRVLFAGEAMPVPQINQWVENYPDCLFSNLYGPTEITVDCTAYTFYERFEGDILPIGYPCRNSDILILNDDGESSGADEIGELCVRGTSLALGYWNDESKTKSVFIQNPNHQKYRDLIYKTGDLVRRNQDGLIFFLGRKDSQIKHMGYRIELGEIEAAVMQTPQVANACVVYDQNVKKIICVIQVKMEEELSEIAVKRFLISKLPKYMVPSEVFLINHMPMNANGKINRMEVASFARSKLT